MRVAVSLLTNIREQLTLMRPFDVQTYRQNSARGRIEFLVARGILLA